MEQPILTRSQAVEMLRQYHNSLFVIALQVTEAERIFDTLIEKLNK